MDKKRFDHIEEDMRAASEGWEAPFDEKAWEHMEQMLEGENDRKRPIAWWMWLLPLLLVTGMAAYFILNNDKSPETSTASSQSIAAGNKENKSLDNANQTDNISDKTTASFQSPDNPADGIVKDDTKKDNIQQGNNKGAMRMHIVVPANFSDGTNADLLKDPKKISDKRNGKMKMTVSGGMASADEDKENNKEQPQAERETTIVSTAVTTPVPQQTVAKTEKPAAPVIETEKEKRKDTVASKDKTAKQKQSKPSRFYFSLFAGMEGNGVHFPGLNKVSTRAGFTVGYQLTKNLSIQTGLFAGSKKYVAGKYDYKAKAGTYWAMVDIQQVDANCRVFEIPLNLRYDFNPAKKWKFFAVTGLSSYIMDKEDYAYDYIRNSMPYHAEASYTGNQHLFSVWRIGAGVETKLSKQFSLGINPGLAIPLAGVGEGEIKLFSSELLMSLKYRPFKKSK